MIIQEIQDLESAPQLELVAEVQPTTAQGKETHQQQILISKTISIQVDQQQSQCKIQAIKKNKSLKQQLEMETSQLDQ